jgi:DNA uptake protein ComE-like DNA-binding protein
MGISEKQADNIVSTRPFKSLDDLLKVNGMGPKLLKRCATRSICVLSAPLREPVWQQEI